MLIASALAATSLITPVGISPALAAAALFGLLAFFLISPFPSYLNPFLFTSGTGTAAFGGNILGQNMCLG